MYFFQKTNWNDSRHRLLSQPLRRWWRRCCPFQGIRSLPRSLPSSLRSHCPPPGYTSEPAWLWAGTMTATAPMRVRVEQLVCGDTWGWASVLLGPTGLLWSCGGAPFELGGALVFAWRRACRVVTGESLERAGVSGSQLVGVNHRAGVRCRRGGVWVVGVGLEGVSRPRTRGDGGQRASFGYDVRAGVTFCPRHSLWRLSVLPVTQGKHTSQLWKGFKSKMTKRTFSVGVLHSLWGLAKNTCTFQISPYAVFITKYTTWEQRYLDKSSDDTINLLLNKSPVCPQKEL